MFTDFKTIYDNFRSPQSLLFPPWNLYNYGLSMLTRLSIYIFTYSQKLSHTFSNGQNIDKYHE
jgi:hypothetical protein